MQLLTSWPNTLNIPANSHTIKYAPPNRIKHPCVVFRHFYKNFVEKFPNLDVLQSVRRNWRLCKCKVEKVLWFIERWVPLHSFLVYMHLPFKTLMFAMRNYSFWIFFLKVSLNCYVFCCFTDFHFRFVSDSRGLHTKPLKFRQKHSLHKTYSTPVLWELPLQQTQVYF